MKKTDKAIKQKTKPHPPTFFSNEFKKKIITEYLESNLTKREILDKHGIHSNSPIQNWMRKFGIIDPYAKKDYLGVTNFNRLKKKKPTDLKLNIRKKYDTK